MHLDFFSFLYFLMLFLFLTDIWSNFLITWSLQTHATIISINMKSGCHRRNFNTKGSRGEFFLRTCVHTHAHSHTYKTQKNVLPLQTTGPCCKHRNIFLLHVSSILCPFWIWRIWRDSLGTAQEVVSVPYGGHNFLLVWGGVFWFWGFFCCFFFFN